MGLRGHEPAAGLQYRRMEGCLPCCRLKMMGQAEWGQDMASGWWGGLAGSGDLEGQCLPWVSLFTSELHLRAPGT